MGTLRGLIFDLDGTLVDSGLDFDLMRRQMQLTSGEPILESLERLSAADAERCRAILREHEDRGAATATLMPGVGELLTAARAHGLRCGLMTRNCRRATEATLARLAIELDPVVCREDGPVKPDPRAVLEICSRWQLPPDSVAVIGDDRFDLEAGRRAGATTVLVLAGRDVQQLPWAREADLVLESFVGAWPQLVRLTAAVASPPAGSNRPRA